MRLRSYHANDYEAVKEMLQDHINYAPEYIGQDSNTADMQYFEESFLSSRNGFQAYVLLDDENGIASFMTYEKREGSYGLPNFYITNLFVRHQREAECNAVNTIRLFKGFLSRDTSLYINVNPGAQSILAFWQQIGLHIQPERSVFSNVDGETIASLLYSDSSENGRT